MTLALIQVDSMFGGGNVVGLRYWEVPLLRELFSCEVQNYRYQFSDICGIMVTIQGCKIIRGQFGINKIDAQLEMKTL